MTKQDPVVAPSEALLAAQRRLQDLRDRHRATRPSQPPLDVPKHGRLAIPTPQQALPAALPTHLGWESAAVTAVLRRQSAGSGSVASQSWNDMLRPLTGTDAPTPEPPAGTPEATLTVFPDIALGMLRHNLSAAGRLWLLLRHLDAQGCGRLALEAVRTAVAGRNSRLRVCGPRQLRNLLGAGDGIFWTRDRDRIWLRATAKVAAALDITRLTARPVALPSAILTGPIGALRAHLYASFHSARDAAPIARETLQRVTAVPARTQRHYEQRLDVDVRANFAIGARAGSTDPQAAAWEQGLGSFTLIDHNGRNGQPGTRYQAWQLPNSYSGPHPRLAKHARKRVNRRLADLQHHGTAGNDQSPTTAIARRYAGSGREAAGQITKSGQTAADAIYWPAPGAADAATGIWYVLQA